MVRLWSIFFREGYLTYAEVKQHSVWHLFLKTSAKENKGQMGQNLDKWWNWVTGKKIVIVLLYFMYIWKFPDELFKIWLFAKKNYLFFFQGPYYWESLWDKTHIAIKQLKSQSKENKRSQLSKISHSITKCV